MRSSVLLLLMGLVRLTANAHAETRLSGTYVAHGPTFAEMLQLTQTDNGQITGVLSGVDLKADGKLDAQQEPLTGTVDSDQIVLKIGGAFSARSFAGTVSGGTIRLQSIGTNGDVLVSLFTRATPLDYQGYADHLKAKSKATLFNVSLERTTQALDRTVRDATKWRADTEIRVQKISGLKD
jgi:hypothetical protein